MLRVLLLVQYILCDYSMLKTDYALKFDSLYSHGYYFKFVFLFPYIFDLSGCIVEHVGQISCWIVCELLKITLVLIFLGKSVACNQVLNKKTYQWNWLTYLSLIKSKYDWNSIAEIYYYFYYEKLRQIFATN